MRKLLFLLSAFVIHAFTLNGQADSTAEKKLKEVTVSSARENRFLLPHIANGFLWAGKKNEVISLQNLDANIAEKTPRQVFSKIPGVFVYDMDGSGNQTNISTRGLDPHRGWEFNIRTDGIINNSDIYGYPASHFSLPLEAVSKIELVRGSGALQYGAQFGGMLNYVLKQPDTTREISFESINSLGSFGLVSTYNAVGGKIGRLQYFAFISKRNSDGYRENGESNYDGEGVVLNFQASKQVALKASVLRSNYVYHIPGPLTDAMFEDNPRQATRSRNYFNPEIWVPSLTATWDLGLRTQLKWTGSAVLGERRSVQFDRAATIPDTINAATRDYNPRQVDIDGFNSYTTELRLLHQYQMGSQINALTVAVQYFNNDLNRRQQGKGTTGSDPDFSISAAGWGRDLHLKSENISLAVEHKFSLSKQFSISPGIRYESGASKLSGATTYYDPAELQNTIVHKFPLLGINGEWQFSNQQLLYGGFSQAYRPVLFKDIIPANVYEQSDKNLKDAFGYNLELGYRGSSNHFKWDVSAFKLQYNNRVGTIAQFSPDIDTFVLYRTNIGDSRTLGLEMYIEYSVKLWDKLHLSLFTSTAYFDAEYLGDSLRNSAKENKSIKGKKIESVPSWISRNGLNLRMRDLSLSFLYSYTGSNYSDPFNTETPSANGTVGKVPAYDLFDINASWRYRNLMVRLSLNNATNKQYFTKRPLLYPGAGVWPSDGRSFVASVGITI